ncbi:hypothetical protein [Agromyces humatus]|uniref:Uncharacterized protein n=1 Tax=Agromyces humatus TaxID=279573 RepID=A0ABP4XBR1_9MICO|nr:hypothetical protein [Agromyces humatus]
MRAVIDSTIVTLDGVVNHMERRHFDIVDHDKESGSSHVNPCVRRGATT